MNFKALLTVIFCILVFAATAKSQTEGAQNGKQEKDRPVKIKKKSHPSSGGNCRNPWGTTVLKVTFDKSAKITNVEMISSSNCDYFDRSAVKAAGKIKFEPAIKNGEPITVVKTVTYSFSAY